MNGTQRNSKKVDPPNKEPIAIVGIGCRFPGMADSPDAFWHLLANGVDALSETPKTRWNNKKFHDKRREIPGTVINREAGFLSEPIDEYDAAFFGISPREAAHIDPQQRILMELVWEALEDAGASADAWRGEDVGVYVGGFTTDKLLSQFDSQSRDAISQHTATSSTLGMLANRLSYQYDFRGPSITIDTACSSSLVALNYACNDLWHGQCDMAIAAGINVMLRPEFPIAMTKGNFLSAQSRSRAFDAGADGYARGEGGGLVVLKPLSQAVADSDRIYACIRGIGVNQDGHTSGITVPNGSAQTALIRKIHKDFGIDPAEISYIEAHGTGTKIGDPIEVRALGDAFAHGREVDRSLGSLKANIGHQEAAAGIAAVIKAALVIQNETVPPQVNFDVPNPEIPFEDLRFHVATSCEPLAVHGKSANVCVNSFGFGGTNAHAVLCGVTDVADVSTISGSGRAAPFVLPLSAHSRAALVCLASSFADQIETDADTGLNDYMAAMALRRTHLPERLAIVCDDRADCVAALRSVVSQTPTAAVHTGKAMDAKASEVTFVYTGMGPQWHEMGRQLYQHNRVYRHAVEDADAAFQRHASFSILSDMLQSDDPMHSARNDIAQPANFVLQVGLTAVWRSMGVVPGSIVGHSVGEVCAAYASGALSLDDAARVSFERSRCQQKLAGRGGMIAAGLDLESAQELVALYPEQVSIAAHNGPASVALAGDHDALQEISEMLLESDIFCKKLRVEVAYHSHQMHPIEAELKSALAGLKPRVPDIPLWSTVTGQRVDRASNDATYWWRNVREPVRLADAIAGMVSTGARQFLEVGPHPVLAPAIKAVAAAAGASAMVLHSMRRQTDEQATLTNNFASLFCAGAQIDWSALCGRVAPHIQMPLYPWQRLRHWSETASGRDDRLGTGTGALLGDRVFASEPRWHSTLTEAHVGYLRDHVVNGDVVFPGAAYVNMMIDAHKEMTQSDVSVVENIAFQNVLAFGDADKPVLQTAISEDGTSIRIHGRMSGTEQPWTACCHAQMSTASGLFTMPKIDIASLRSRLVTEVDISSLYQSFSRRGLEYGPTFQGIEQVFAGNGHFLARIEMTAPDADQTGDTVQPAVLDAGFQGMIAGLADAGMASDATFVPTKIARIRTTHFEPKALWCYGEVSLIDHKTLRGDLYFCDDSGSTVLEAIGVVCKALPQSHGRADKTFDTLCHTVGWCAGMPVPRMTHSDETWTVVSDDQCLISLLKSGLEQESVAFRIIATSALDADVIANSEQIVVAIGSTEAKDDPFARLLGLLDVAQAIGAAEAHFSAPLTVVTTLGHFDPPAARATDQFGLTGLTRAIGNELPHLSCRTIDIGRNPDTSIIRQLIDEIASKDRRETEVALTTQGRFVQRLTPIPLPKSAKADAPAPTLDTPFALETSTDGGIDSARFVQVDRRAPGPGEIEVRIRSVSLNFKDVLKMLGVLSHDVVEGTFFKNAIGMESAFEVVRVGEGVTGFGVGDQVIAALPGGCVRKFATVPAKDVHGVPCLPDLDLRGQAGAPTIYVTAYYALKTIANLQPGERLLVHSATGGVGFAAIQIARMCGAEVFATAGSTEKRDYLRTLGVENIYDSRSLDFADEIMRDTDGAGVDVVLNFLHGEAQQKSVGLLAPFGRFIEIGKRDIEDNRGLSLADFNRNLQFTALDIDRMLAEKPEVFDRTLNLVWEDVRAGHLQLPPTTAFPVSDFVGACHALRRANHFGKIILDVEGQTVPVQMATQDATRFRSDAAYLVTGGLGGFGLRLTEWLAANGAGHLILASRTGQPRPEDTARYTTLTKSGVIVTPIAADVSDKADVDRMFARLSAEGIPLRGVFHCAGLLKDAMISKMSHTDFMAPMGPKALGAWNLHQATVDMPLDQFVLFSSISAIVGQVGQANYASANDVLDQLAIMRSDMGLPALSINWGAISEAGMVARDTKIKTHLSHMGIAALDPGTALAALGRVMERELTHVALADVDWDQWRKVNPSAGEGYRFAEVLAESADVGNSPQLDALLKLSKKEQESAISQLLVDGVSEVIHASSSQLDTSASLSQLGIDSLMMVEVQVYIEKCFGIDLSAMTLARLGTIDGITSHLLESMDVKDTTALAPVTGPYLVPSPKGEEPDLEVRNIG